MKSDPVSPQGLAALRIGGLDFQIETPPDLDALLDRAAASHPDAVDEIPYYAILWPAARGLAEYLVQQRAHLKGRRLIELGCGLGLPSIVAAKLGAKVLATDFHEDAGEWLRHNAELNGVRLDYRRLDWSLYLGQRKPDPDAADWVIGSDLLYERRHIPDLAAAIAALAKPGARIAISDPGRDNLSLFTRVMAETGWEADLVPEGEIYVCTFER